MSDTPIIELVNVSKRFGNQVVLDGVNLSLRRGETTVVLGESGAGKSVLLKHIVGLLAPDSGEVYLEGTRIDTLPINKLMRLRENFGYLFQLSALFDSMTAGENVAFPIVQRKKISRAEVDRLVSEKLKLVGLDGVQSKMPSELSGGQKKRVALARAIALEPSVILYDEPTTGLDPVRSDVINELILRLRNAMKVTSVVVTHDMTSAFKVADRVIMLQGGRFIFDGDCESLKSSDNETVRKFIEGRASESDLLRLEEV
jgi:phospholipid/cholesterol/gamma-HCH transport system ATP-binding protein